jgi:signal transduction histidine kinase
MQKYVITPMVFSPNPDLVGQKVHKRMVSTPDLRLLSALAQDLGEVCQAYFCVVVAGRPHIYNDLSIGLWQDKSNQPPLTPKVINRLLSERVLHTILRSTESYRLNKAHRRRGDLKFPVEGTMLLLPVWLHGNYQGFILLGYEQELEWSPPAETALQAIGQSVAIALERIDLQQQVQTYRQHQTLVKDLNHATFHPPNLETIYEVVLTRTSQVLPIERSWFFLLSYSNPMYYLSPQTSPPEIEVKIVGQWSANTETQTFYENSPTLFSFDLTTFPLLQQAWENAPDSLIINDISLLDPEQCRAPTLFNLHEHPGLLIIPLIGSIGSDNYPLVMGFLMFQSQSHVWSTGEIELLNTIAVQTSVAIQNYRTVLRVQSLVEERTNLLEASLKVRNSLLQKTREQAHRLSHLNQLKDEFLSTIQHELNTPLTSMRMVIENLRRLGHSPEHQQRYERYLQILEEQWHREKELIQNLLKFQEIESLETQSSVNLQMHTVELSTIIHEVSQKFHPQWSQKQLNLITQYYSRSEAETLKLKTDPDSFRRILDELLRNATKFAVPQTLIYLSVRQEQTPTGKETTLKVTNTGIGISSEEQTYIFQPFRRGKGVTSQAIPGIGLGLALVEGLVQHLNGKIEVSSSPVAGSTSAEVSFELTLPE